MNWKNWLFEEQEEKTDPAEELRESLDRTRAELAQAHAGFNSAADPELVESYIYEIRALKTRYSYLLRQLKELSQPAPQPGVALPV